MSIQDQQLETIEISIKQAQANIALKRALIRLQEDTNFNKLIMEGYFENEAVRLVLLRADPSQQGTDDQVAINKSIDAIGFLRQYLVAVNQIGTIAEKAIKEDEQTREDILAEHG
jgi:hypothetical protein